jgi:hypothetical protein
MFKSKRIQIQQIRRNLNYICAKFHKRKTSTCLENTPEFDKINAQGQL